jgi:hypothetical protein
MLQPPQKDIRHFRSYYYPQISDKKLRIQPIKINNFVALLESDKPFSFARYGNGEWDCALGLGTGTGSGSQVFTDDLREAMRETILNNRGVMMGMQNTRYLTKCRLIRPIYTYLHQNEIVYSWYTGDVFHYASKNKEMAPLVNVLRKKKFVMVGPQWLENLSFVDEVIVIKEKNCWEDVDDIHKELSHYHDCVIGFAAGPTANVLIHRLHGTNQLIDFGSVFDVYSGVITRKYHNEITDQHFEVNRV